MLSARLADAIAGLRCWPGPRGWGRAALELAWAIPLLLLVAHLGGLIRLGGSPDPITSLQLAATLFFVPALGEELLFRALIIPRKARRQWWLALSVALFVLWHPLQAFTFGPPWAGALLDPWFLAATAILGIALGRIYLATSSLWPCIAAHWLIVLGWKLFFGGPF